MIEFRCPYMGQCDNDGICNVDDNYCQCPLGWGGSKCSILQQCNSTPCQNDGFIQLDSNGQCSTLCTCRGEWVNEPGNKKGCTQCGKPCAKASVQPPAGIPSAKCDWCACRRGWVGDGCDCTQIYLTLWFVGFQPEHFTRGQNSTITTPLSNDQSQYLNIIAKSISSSLNKKRSEVDIVLWRAVVDPDDSGRDMVVVVVGYHPGCTLSQPQPSESLHDEFSQQSLGNHSTTMSPLQLTNAQLYQDLHDAQSSLSIDQSVYELIPCQATHTGSRLHPRMLMTIQGSGPEPDVYDPECPKSWRVAHKVKTPSLASPSTPVVLTPPYR